MNDLQIFENSEFGKIRTITKDNEPMFCLADVCKALELTNSRSVADRLEDDERCKLDLPRQGETWFVTESGLYAVILRSDKPNAKKFRKWVTGEVLPSIRKNGGYIANQENLTPEQIVANALVVAQNIITQKDKQIEEMTPKANYFDALVDKKLNTNIRDTAKELGIGEKAFVSFLIGKGYVFRQGKHKQLRPYAKYAESGNGLFVLKDKHNEQNGWTGQQMYVTPKGKETFRLLLEERE
jgi:toxin-antitoxin system, toxin component, bro family